MTKGNERSSERKKPDEESGRRKVAKSVTLDQELIDQIEALAEGWGVDTFTRTCEILIRRSIERIGAPEAGEDWWLDELPERTRNALRGMAADSGRSAKDLLQEILLEKLPHYQALYRQKAAEFDSAFPGRKKGGEHKPKG